MSRAATRLHMAQPSLSEQLRKLERELGVQLFDRKPRNMVLTPAGEAFRIHAERILSEVELTHRHLDTVVAQAGQRVRIGVLPTVAARLLPDVIRDFRRLYPTIDIVLREENASSNVEHVLAQGEIDVAVIRINGTLPPQLDASLLLREPLVALVPPGHYLARSSQASLKELGVEPLLTLKTGYGLRELVLNVLNEVGVTPNISVEVSQLEFLMGLVEAGLGLTILPRLAINTNRRYTQVHIYDQHAVRELYTVWRRDIPVELETPLRAFIDSLQIHADRLVAG